MRPLENDHNIIVKIFVKSNLRILYFACLFLSILFSCRKSELSWNTELLTPLLKSSLSFKDIVQDSILSIDSSQNLTYVFDKKLYHLSVDSLFTFRDTGLTKSYSLDSLSLYNANISYPITLGAICLQAGLLGFLIISQNGQNIAIPSIPSFSAPVVPISADSIFTTMTLATGQMDISFTNGLPIDITNVVFELRNQSTNELIVQGNFPLIASNTTETKSYNLDGKTLEGKLNAQLISFGSPGSNGIPVLVDTSNAILANIKVYNLHPSIATARWPQQNIINKTQNFYLKTIGVELKESRIKSGKLRLNLKSTLQDSVRFAYKLPSATKNGIPFEVYKTLEPAPPGGLSIYSREFDFSGYHLDLSGPNNDTFNTASNTFIAAIDSTGQLKTLSLSDNFFAEIALLDIKPEYARGYLNQTNFNYGPAKVALEEFNSLNGMIQFDQLQMDITVENNIGAAAVFNIDQLTSINTKQNNVIDLISAIIKNPLYINRAKDNNKYPPIIPAIERFKINSQNSNINAFINNLPDQIEYAIRLQTNPNGNELGHNDFIYDGKLLNIDFHLEAPLNLSIKGLQLSDTIDINLNQVDLSQVEKGTLNLIAKNGFPIDARIIMSLLDEHGISKYILLDGNQIIKAAPINSNGKVDQKLQSIIRIPIDQKVIEQLTTYKHIKIDAIFDTKPTSSNVKLYSTYDIDFILTGDFIYRIK